jgi:hypothetical protein
LDNSESAIRDLREETIKKIGGKGARTEAFDVYYTEILAPAWQAANANALRQWVAANLRLVRLRSPCRTAKLGPAHAARS